MAASAMLVSCFSDPGARERNRGGPKTLAQIF